jgi:hypothetical protein
MFPSKLAVCDHVGCFSFWETLIWKKTQFFHMHPLHPHASLEDEQDVDSLAPRKWRAPDRSLLLVLYPLLSQPRPQQKIWRSIGHNWTQTCFVFFFLWHDLIISVNDETRPPHGSSWVILARESPNHRRKICSNHAWMCIPVRKWYITHNNIYIYMYLSILYILMYNWGTIWYAVIIYPLVDGTALPSMHMEAS